MKTGSAGIAAVLLIAAFIFAIFDTKAAAGDLAFAFTNQSAAPGFEPGSALRTDSPPQMAMPGGFVLKGWPAPGLAPGSAGIAESTEPEGPAAAIGPAGGRYFAVERSLDGNKAWDLGARLDLAYGTNHPFAAVGHPAEPGTAPMLGVPQLYLEAGQPEFSLRLGRFFSILGQPSSDGPHEFLSSGFFDRRYGEPLTHTGALGTMRLPLGGGTAMLRAGVVNGWDTVDDGSIDPALLGGIAWQRDGRFWVALSHIGGRQSLEAHPQHDTERQLTSLALGLRPLDGASYVFQRDWGRQETAAALGQAESWSGTRHSLFIDIGRCRILEGDRLQLGLRYESFDETGGTAPGYASAFDPPARDLSFGAEYTGFLPTLPGGPPRTVTIRPSLRWTEHEVFVSDPGSAMDEETLWQFSAALDVRVTF